ncbi:hypothetical protein TBR22_A30050 [Luteitalea sp. TBR-22]|uniref:TolB family protein n=1 Tax=Luteitalea sp. TBR-22 TaxID=2802971 RepID=UPI001AF8BFC5|nr:hypothetical protein [Luteitalea sp. TBR-22]BCS33778.1 hypothetical protein TBR22_A30050 [Luteitalea sp. TBR-22]
MAPRRRALAVLRGIDPADARPVVGRHGQRIAWEERQEKRSVVRLNGVVQGTAHDEIAAIRFSASGERFAYAARDGKVWQFVVDGTASAAYEAVGGLQFSEDGHRVAFSAKRDGKWLVVVDGVSGRPYDEVGAPMLSADGSRVIYPAKRNRKWVVVENGQERGPEADKIWLGEYHVGRYVITGMSWAFPEPRSEAGATPQPHRYAYYVQAKDGWVPPDSATTAPCPTWVCPVTRSS